MRQIPFFTSLSLTCAFLFQNPITLIIPFVSSHLFCSGKIPTTGIIMTLSGAPPPPLWHPPIAMMPYYLFADFGSRRTCATGNTPTIAIAPRPPRGTGGARGGRHNLKIVFREQYFHNHGVSLFLESFEITINICVKLFHNDN